MMKFFILLFSFLQFSFFPTHEIPVALFKMKVSDEGITLNAVFDKEDLEKAISSQSNSTVSEGLIKEYILKNIEWRINEKKITLKIHSIENNQEHYLITIDFPTISEQIESISIYNACLVNEIENHSNIIYFNYQKEETRGFRLDKNRLRTSFEL